MSVRPAPIELRVGDVVQIKTREEILATLAGDGTLDAMPFMPEMLAFAGRELVVEKRAHKTCDTIAWTGLRRVDETVHLAGSRCDGSAHGGCQAACQIYWKDAWLTKVPRDGAPVVSSAAPASASACTEADLHAATRQPTSDGNAEVLYRCQATELLQFTHPLSSWDFRQYVHDVRSGNATLYATIKALAWRVFRWSNGRFRGYKLQQSIFNHMQRLRGGMTNVPLAGDKVKTPRETLSLAVGERVQVKSVEEIRDTLNVEQRNRGLYFDKEMQPYCNKAYQVGARVTQIIEEKTGRMMQLPGDCLILEGVICTGRYHWNCPRASPSYWREIWLRRATEQPQNQQPG